MSIGSASFGYTLNNFDVVKNYDTRVNIKTELEYLRFSSSFQSEGLGLSYLTSPGIDPDKNILLIDTSNIISSNAKESVDENEFLVDNFVINYAGFNIADVVKTIDGIPTPLYYWHDMSNVVSFNNLEILDSNKNPVNPSLYLFADETSTLGYTRKGVYSNIVCSISQAENSYEVFYIRYKDLATNLVVEKLLDSKLYYEQASFISERTERKYIVTQLGMEYVIQVVFDSFNFSPTPALDSQRFWLKRKKQSKITLEKPGVVSAAERWNMRISPGDFFDGGRKYWVPEYYLQLFSPVFPYKLVKENKAKVINKNLIYLDTHPIANLGIDGYFVYIVIKEPNGAVKRVFTNDPEADTYITKQGFVTDIFYEKDVIESISANSGFILLNQDILDGQEVFITCRYIERYYSYDYLSVNPSINPEVLGKKLVFYIVPNASDRGVHHLVVDNNGIINASSESPTYVTFEGMSTGGSIGTLVDTKLPALDYFSGYELEILSGSSSGFKAKIASYNAGTQTLALAATAPYQIEEKVSYRIIKKLEPYSSGGFTYNGWEGTALGKGYFKIGEVYVTQTLSIPDISMLDTRVLGGGISDKNIESALKLQNETAWYWDLGNWDGTAYPGMGAIVVYLPRYILKELGGEFEREQVTEIVKRHVAGGSYVITKYYDESTEIRNIVPGNKQATISWYLVDANHYNVYIGSSPDNLSLYSTEPGTRTNLTISNLENDKNYYVQVAPIVGGIERLGSRVLGFMPFNYSSTLPGLKYGEGEFMEGSYE
jgi:hypothetical protein